MTAAEAAGRRHDIVNALTAIEGAATILGDDDLPARDRATLARLLTSGVHRLRALVEASEARADPVSLAGVAGEVAAEARWRGRVTVAVATELLTAVPASQVADVVRDVLSTACDRAPDTGLTLRGWHEGETVGLWLQVGSNQPMSPMSPDLADGFRVAARLMEGHDGVTYVAVVADEGCMGICLPAAPDEARGEDPGV